MGYIIWWLNADDCKNLERQHVRVRAEEEATAIDGLPEYVKDEFWSRYTRAGRGRLWVSPLLDLPADFAITWDVQSNAVKKFSFSDYGGIVLLASDKPSVVALPGVLTDLDLRILGE